MERCCLNSICPSFYVSNSYFNKQNSSLIKPETLLDTSFMQNEKTFLSKGCFSNAAQEFNVDCPSADKLTFFFFFLSLYFFTQTMDTTTPPRQWNILLGATGSVASIKLPQIVDELNKVWKWQNGREKKPFNALLVDSRSQCQSSANSCCLLFLQGCQRQCSSSSRRRRMGCK